MIQRINGMLKKVSDLHDQINNIKNLDEKVSGEVQKDVNESLPDFAQVLNRKKATGGGDLHQTIENVSKREGVPPDLVKAVIEVESGFDQSVVSEDGARGLMQIMPETAKQLQINPDDPTQNIKGGVRYLGKMMDRFGNLDKALSAYNAGPGAVEQYGGIPPFPETENYVKQVKDIYRQLKGTGKNQSLSDLSK
ncbi:MAG: lytic transglycosylase domain-containing protein [bacterium]